MDIELTPKELTAPEIEAIAQRAGEGKGISSGDALALLRHVLWQNDKIEHTKLSLDEYKDRTHGSPAISLH